MSLLTLVLFISVKSLLIQALYQNVGSERNEQFDPDKNNQMAQFTQTPPSQFGGSNQGHNDENILNIGNGYNRKNFVVLNDGSRRNFQESTEKVLSQPGYGTPNTRQKSKYDPHSINVNYIGNGFNNRNLVVMKDSQDGYGRPATSLRNNFRPTSQVLVYKNPTAEDPTWSDYLNGNQPTKSNRNNNPPNTRNTYENRKSNVDKTDFTQIGHGPENHNTIFMNGEQVFSDSGMTVGIERNEPQFRSSNQENHDENILSIGNGYDRKNIVSLNEGPKRNFQETTGISYTNQRPKHDPNSIFINNIGNGFNDRDLVMTQNNNDGLGQPVTPLRNDFRPISQDKNNNPLNSRNSFENRAPDVDNTFTFNKIGHGLENHNTFVHNGDQVFSDSGTNIITNKNIGIKRNEVVSFDMYPNIDDLKVLPLKRNKK